MCDEQDFLKIRERTIGMVDYGYSYSYNHSYSYSATNVQNENKKCIKCRLIDVGGTRAEDQNGLNFVATGMMLELFCVCFSVRYNNNNNFCFNDNYRIDCMLFVVGLSDYDAILFEDSKTNAMLESVNVFEKTVNGQFGDVNLAIFLILTKDDLFRSKLRHEKVPLSKCFSEKGNWQRKMNIFMMT